MRLTIRAHRLRITDSVREHAERRLLFALGRYRDAVTRVEIRLIDVNGPRGGIDKRCTIFVALRRAGEIVLDERDTDLRAVVDRAADRAGRAVSRRLHRQQCTDSDRAWRTWRSA